jgi:CRISPR-associated exonuclease Cas4
LVEGIAINGTIIDSYLVCKRQAWLQSRRVIPPQDHPLLEMGRIINDYSYQHELKSVQLENIQIDLVRKENEEVLIGEVKKSSKAEDIARMQLLFYMYRLEQMGVKSKGILLFPKEKRRIAVEMTDQERDSIEHLINEITKLIALESPPPVKKIPFCKNCAYKEMCFA